MGFMTYKDACSLAAGRHAQASSRRFGVRLDGIFADVEQPGDFLGLEMLGDQTQDFLLTGRQLAQTFQNSRVFLDHARGLRNVS